MCRQFSLATVWRFAFLLLIFGVGLTGCDEKAQRLPVNQSLGGNFSLPSTRERVEGVQAFRGQVVLLNFGFTSCPDICPMVLARLSQLYEQLGDHAKQTRVLFVTVDPEHDTVAQLQEYLRFFNPEFVGFSGTEAQIKQVARQYGAVFMREDNAGPDVRSFSHSDFVYLLDQQGRIRKLYSTEDSLQAMGADIRYLLAEKEGFWGKILAFFNA